MKNSATVADIGIGAASALVFQAGVAFVFAAASHAFGAPMDQAIVRGTKWGAYAALAASSAVGLLDLCSERKEWKLAAGICATAALSLAAIDLSDACASYLRPPFEGAAPVAPSVLNPGR